MNESRYRSAERDYLNSLGIEPSERLVVLESTGTRVRVQEVGGGPTVLLIHGASNSGVSWAPLVAELPDLRCVMVDRPGCGLSEALPRRFADIAALETYADGFVAALLDALELPSALVIATSLGGYLTLRSAATHPTRIERIALIGAPFGVAPSQLPVAMRMSAIPGLGPLMARIPPSRGAVRAVLRQAGLRDAIDAGRVNDTFVDCFRSLLRDTPTMLNEIQAGPRIISPWSGMDPRIVLGPDVLARIVQPVGLLWGDHDILGGPAVAETFASSLPNCELEVMRGAGHAPWIDDPAHAATRSREWLLA
ncbi:MAG TPA: alpha/beta hydrolase [Microthrixaceae bacterium]|nr:alpha/beta hydrolase [Microthrixaceae bacterium]